MQVKTTRHPFNDTPVRGSKPLEIIHSDIAGPVSPSLNGCVYYVTFIDDFTGMVNAFALKDKSAKTTLAIFDVFRAHMERAWNAQVRVLRTDGGGEYKKEFDARLTSIGIVHQMTTRHTPQLNGVAERWNRTLKEMAGAILVDSGLTHEFWTLALQHAQNVLNMTNIYEPLKKSVYEIIWARRTNIDKLQPFGCIAWIHVPREVRKKNDFTTPRAVKGTHLGLNPKGDGWILLPEGGKSTIASRDVRFTEVRDEVMEELGREKRRTEPVDESARVVLIEDDDAEAELEIDDGIEVPVQESDQQHSQPVDLAQPITSTTASATPPTNGSVPAPPNQTSITVGRTLGRANRGQRSFPDMFVQYSAMIGTNLRPVHVALAASLFSDDPATFREAMESEMSPEWWAAMQREFGSIRKNGTWEEVIVPDDGNVVGCKWVYKVKTDGNGQVVKYKARVVAKGYLQIYSIDFDETFSSVARLTSLRILLTIVARDDLELHQMDADTAFLNGTLDDTIYMEFPDGYEPKASKATGLLLKKSLYGLKQASRCWWELITGYLAELGFRRLDSDWGLYVK